MLSRIRRVRRRDEQGASAVEYGLLIAAIAAVIVIVIFALGSVVKDLFKNTCNSVAASAATSTSC